MAHARKRIRKQAYRPSTIPITQDYIDRVLSALRVGHFVDTAAALSGVPKKVFFGWLETGRDAAETRAEGQLAFDIDPQVELCLQLYDEMPRAIAEAEDADVRAIMVASADDWKAAAWMLERRFAVHWDKLKRYEPAQITQNNAAVIMEENHGRLQGRSAQELVARAAMLSQRLADTTVLMPMRAQADKPQGYLGLIDPPEETEQDDYGHE